VAPREVLLRHPFGPTDSRDGFGAGDWDFACATLAAGVQHLVVPDTVCFVRRTHQVDGEPRGGERIARPSPLFDVEPEQARAAPRSPARKGRLVGRLFGWLYRCVKSVALRHPRWNRLGVQIADAFRDFFGAGAKAQGVLPAWLVDDWRRIHEVEPELFPGEADLRALHLEEATPSNIAPIFPLRARTSPPSTTCGRSPNWARRVVSSWSAPRTPLRFGGTASRRRCSSSSDRPKGSRRPSPRCCWRGSCSRCTRA